MMVLSPTRIFDGETMLSEASIRIESGRIVEILSGPAPHEALKLEGLLAPGLIDIQVNGGGGVLFNDQPTLEALKTIAAAHVKFGVTGVMATLIYDDRVK